MKNSINPTVISIFKQIENEIRQKGALLITSHSFKSENADGTVTKTKGPGRLSFQQFVKNNCLENTIGSTNTEFSFSPVGKKKFKEMEASLEEVPMIAAMLCIQNELGKHDSFGDSDQMIYKRFLIKKKKEVLTTLVFSILLSESDGGSIVIYFDEITKKAANQDWGFPYEGVMFAGKIAN